DLPSLLESRLGADVKKGKGFQRAPQHAVSKALAMDRILFFKGHESREEILTNLVSTLGLESPLVALRAILAREMSGSTNVSTELAIPHARLPGIDSVRAAIGIVRHPIRSDSVRIWLVFVSPEEPVRDHLTFLAAVARMFSAAGFSDGLQAFDSAEEVLSY